MAFAGDAFAPLHLLLQWNSHFCTTTIYSVDTDNDRLKKVVFLGCLTFHCYGGSEKRLLLEIHLSDMCVSFLWIMVVQFKWLL